MLTVLGNPKQCCDGVRRRDFLRASGLGALGTLAAGPASASPLATFGRAKSVVVLYLYGAPSQMDTFDPKPDAPVETRGEFATIPTALTGVNICEHLPKIAGLLDQFALVRSMTHEYPTHAVAYALSGVPISDAGIEANAREPRHWPYFGSVLDYHWSQGRHHGLPQNLYLPWPLNSRTNNKMHGGLHAAWLGDAWNPAIPDFIGQATREQGAPSADGNTAIFSKFDPFDGITPESTFRFSGTQRPVEITLDRFDRRRSLLEQFDQQLHTLEGHIRQYGHVRQSAIDLMNGPKLAAALDVTREPVSVRERYGHTLFGQGALAARRLIEAGGRVVTVFWDEFGPVNTAWDTHANNFPRLKQGLCPTLDQVLPAFVNDMHERGLLEETLVLVISEHGRTPRLANVPGGSRDHWSYAYSGLFTGAGIHRGQVIGETDRQGGYVTARPINPKDILATMYHLLGIDPHATTTDRQGRPMPLLPYGELVPELVV